MLSLPSRECGLKFALIELFEISVKVTPFAGVWIEIILTLSFVHLPPMSLPSRECGLKFWPMFFLRRSNLSLPSRECGLKYAKNLGLLLIRLSLPSRECGLKSFNDEQSFSFGSHSLRGSVD